MRKLLSLGALLVMGCAQGDPNFNHKTHSLGPLGGLKVIHFGAKW